MHRALACPSLDRSGNFTGTQTPGTNIHMAGRTVNDRLYTLDIGLPHTIGTSVRVRNLDAESYALVAKFALSHPLHLLAVTYLLALAFASISYNNRYKLKKQGVFYKKTKKIVKSRKCCEMKQYNI